MIAMTWELAEPPAEPSCTIREPLAPLQSLAGIDWQGVAAEARGEVALIDVAPGEGELQQWRTRREVAELEASIADLDGRIEVARASVYAGPDDGIMAGLEAEVAPLQRVRRKLRHALVVQRGMTQPRESEDVTGAGHRSANGQVAGSGIAEFEGNLHPQVTGDAR